jgi:hypothetical protein
MKRIIPHNKRKQLNFKLCFANLFNHINHKFMTYKFKALPKSSILVALVIFSGSAMAQDGTIYPLKTPVEPNAIPLGNVPCHRVAPLAV